MEAPVGVQALACVRSLKAVLQLVHSRRPAAQQHYDLRMTPVPVAENCYPGLNPAGNLPSSGKLCRAEDETR
jgi:hypothetical protein